MNNIQLKRVYLLYRNGDAPPLFMDGIATEPVLAKHYCVTLSVPIIEIDRLHDLYEMYRIKRSGVPRSVKYGDVITHDLHVGMLIHPPDAGMDPKSCALDRILFDLQKAYNPFKIIV